MTEHPRDELRRRIIDALEHEHDGLAFEAGPCADRVMALLGRIGERHRDADITTMGDTRQQIVRQRWIVAELAREGEPERIEGEWRG